MQNLKNMEVYLIFPQPYDFKNYFCSNYLFDYIAELYKFFTLN